MSLFEVRGLTRKPWFEDLGFALEAETVTVLRGASGSGKTLLLRTLADLDPCDGGDIFLEGVERKDMTPQEWRRGVRYVHQRAPLLAPTVGASLERAAGVLGPATAGDWSPPPGLEPQQRTAELSGGEAQRLALHIALSCCPRVLLLDESTSSLDAEAARRAEKDIAAFAAGGRAVLWISHDPSLAQRLGAEQMPFG